MKTYTILAINPGSTSTKLAVYRGDQPVFEKVLRHSHEEIDAAHDMDEALAFRARLVDEALSEEGIDKAGLDAVIGRGGVMRPIAGGTYKVNDKMLEDLRSCRYGNHASNLGGMIADTFAKRLGIPAFIADPTAVDELSDEARLSGYPGIERVSIFHALNQKAVARRYAKSQGKKYGDICLIVAHIGGGISVGAHDHGRVIDVNNALGGDGPFGAERAGSLPVTALARLCFSGKFQSANEVIRELLTKGGLYGYLGTDDGREVHARAEAGDEKAALVYRGMAYQIAREIGASAATLSGRAEVIILTGGFAYDELLTGWIRERVSFIAPVIVMPGEDELRALAEAADRVLSGEEKAKDY